MVLEEEVRVRSTGSRGKERGREKERERERGEREGGREGEGSFTGTDVQRR